MKHSVYYLCAEYNAESRAPEDPELPREHGLLRADVAAVVFLGLSCRRL